MSINHQVAQTTTTIDTTGSGEADTSKISSFGDWIESLFDRTFVNAFRFAFCIVLTALATIAVMAMSWNNFGKFGARFFRMWVRLTAPFGSWWVTWSIYNFFLDDQYKTPILPGLQNFNLVDSLRFESTVILGAFAILSIIFTILGKIPDNLSGGFFIKIGRWIAIVGSPFGVFFWYYMIQSIYYTLR